MLLFDAYREPKNGQKKRLSSGNGLDHAGRSSQQSFRRLVKFGIKNKERKKGKCGGEKIDTFWAGAGPSQFGLNPVPVVVLSHNLYSTRSGQTVRQVCPAKISKLC